MQTYRGKLLLPFDAVFCSLFLILNGQRLKKNFFLRRKPENLIFTFAECKGFILPCPVFCSALPCPFNTSGEKAVVFRSFNNLQLTFNQNEYDVRNHHKEQDRKTVFYCKIFFIKIRPLFPLPLLK
jgi:hypothetical protein